MLTNSLKQRKQQVEKQAQLLTQLMSDLPGLSLSDLDDEELWDVVAESDETDESKHESKQEEADGARSRQGSHCNRNVTKSIVADLTKLGHAESDILMAINDVNVRLSWTHNSPCCVFSETTSTWCIGEIVDVITNPKTNAEELGVMYDEKLSDELLARRVERFSKDILPMSLCLNCDCGYKWNGKIVEHILGKLRAQHMSHDEFQFLHDHDAEQTVTVSHFESVLNMIVHHSRTHSIAINMLRGLQTITPFHEIEALDTTVSITDELLGVKGYLDYLLLLGFWFDDAQSELQCLERPAQPLLDEALLYIKLHIQTQVCLRDEGKKKGADKDDRQLVFAKNRLNLEYQGYKQEAHLHRSMVHKLRVRVEQIVTAMQGAEEYDVDSNPADDAEWMQRVNQQCNQVRAQIRIHNIAFNCAMRQMNWMIENDQVSAIHDESAAETAWRVDHITRANGQKRQRKVALDLGKAHKEQK